MYLKCTRFGSKSASQEFRVQFEYREKIEYISSTITENSSTF